MQAGSPARDQGTPGEYSRGLPAVLSAAICRWASEWLSVRSGSGPDQFRMMTQQMALTGTEADQLQAFAAIQTALLQGFQGCSG